MTLMTHVSRPLVALLVGTVLFFALWIVALKPGSSSSGGAPSGQGGVGQYQSAINAAKSSVKAQNQQSANAGNIPGTATSTPASSSSTPAASSSSAPPATTPAATTPAATTPAATTSTPTQPAAHARAKHHAVVTHKHQAAPVPKAATPASAVHVAGARHRFNVVATALREHKVIAILFYNPAGADDQAVRREIKSIPTYKGSVVKLTVPISELSRYTAITTQVMVSTTPTLVLIDRHHQASLVTGYATGFEIGTLVASALGR
jgi:hypothetical protein